MSAAAILSLIAVGLGIGFISFGASASLHQWVTAEHGVIKSRRDYLGSSLQGLSMVVEAVNHHPRGQRFILFGIVVLTIAAVLGGLSAVEACT